MNDRRHKFVVKYMFYLIGILATWVLFFYLKHEVRFFLIPASIIHFFYLIRDYKIEINESEISIYSFLKSKRVIKISSIKEITIGEISNKGSILGREMKIFILTDISEYDFDIYKFDIEKIENILKRISNNNKFRVINLKKDELDNLFK